MEPDERSISEQDFRVLLHLRSQDEPPACEEGVELLLTFAQASPTLYELAERTAFIDPVHPGFRTNPHWLAFARHRSTCDSCNEV